MKFFFNHIIQRINTHAENSGTPYVLFGIFGIITYPLYHVLWLYNNSQGYGNLGMRLVVVFLCVLLIFKEKWPEKTRVFFPLYWYVTVCYSLPFLFSFFLLKNDFSYVWVLNVVPVLVLLVLILDFIALSIILPLGILLGWLCFKLTSGEAHLPGNYFSILMAYISAIVFGVLFTHRKDIIQKEKLKAVSAVGASVAHELRAPLGALQSSFNGIKRYLPSFMKSHLLAKEAKLQGLDYIRSDHYQSLEAVLTETDDEIEYARTIINMLLTNVDQTKNLSQHPMSICSMADCIEKALKRYPFSSAMQRAFMHWEKGNDFQFRGNEVLMMHVLFNLIKNAIQFVGGVKNGGIYITLAEGQDRNYLYFHDTGKGIPKHLMPKLFTRFFTTTLNGTGLGLSLCKMVVEAFSGEIKCESQEGSYTKFTAVLGE